MQQEITFKETFSPLTSDELVAKEKANMDEKRLYQCNCSPQYF